MYRACFADGCFPLHVSIQCALDGKSCISGDLDCSKQIVSWGIPATSPTFDCSLSGIDVWLASAGGATVTEACLSPVIVTNNYGTAKCGTNTVAFTATDQT